MTIPQLTDPAPPTLADPPRAGGRRLYDGWGRYLLPDPDTGKERPWTRATTLAKALEDTYNLEAWGMRMVAKGMASRPDLMAMAATLNPNDDADKKTLNKVAKDAKEAAGSSAGANNGTALHKITELIDMGGTPDPNLFPREQAAYRRALTAAGLRVDPKYLERIVCVPELDVAGRLDKLLDQGPGLPHQVGDLKSQKSMDFGGVSIAIQLAIYAHAYALWNEETQEWEDPPPMDQVLATVIWLPVGQDTGLLYDVDIAQGWEWAKLALEVRRVRKCKPVTVREGWRPATFGPDGEPTYIPDYRKGPADDAPRGAMDWAREKYPALMKAAAEVDAAEGDVWRDPFREPEQWADVFRHCLSVEELTYYGQRASEALGGQLPAELKELGRELRAKFLATKAS